MIQPGAVRRPPRPKLNVEAVQVRLAWDEFDDAENRAWTRLMADPCYLSGRRYLREVESARERCELAVRRARYGALA